MVVLAQVVQRSGKGVTWDSKVLRGDTYFGVCAMIDLKIGKLAHQDLGQMQMYVNYFDRHVKRPDEKSTVGIILCKKKHDALVEITLPQDANIFASQYQLYLPTKEELRQKLLDWTAEQ